MSKHYDLLARMFPGQALIPAVDAGVALGMAEQTARNKICGEDFPVKTIKLGRRRMVAVVDLAEFLDTTTSTAGKKRGRPQGTTKAARLAAGGEK